MVLLSNKKTFHHKQLLLGLVELYLPHVPLAIHNTQDHNTIIRSQAVQDDVISFGDISLSLPNFISPADSSRKLIQQAC